MNCELESFQTVTLYFYTLRLQLLTAYQRRAVDIQSTPSININPANAARTYWQKPPSASLLNILQIWKHRHWNTCQPLFSYNNGPLPELWHLNLILFLLATYIKADGKLGNRLIGVQTETVFTWNNLRICLF